jgi:site-specific DNA-methyltransferase (adenine-specific)
MKTTAKLHTGDCLSVVAGLPARSCSLVYLDPPFFTQKRHRLVNRARDKAFSFDDLWASASEYGDFLRQRLQQFHRVLTESGSVFFHCDRTASHIARAVLDAVFGEKMFRSEIIWSYRRWSNAQRGLLPQHQTILWYSKSDDYAFNPLHTGYSASTNVDQLLAQRERDCQGKTVYARDASGGIVPSKSKQGVPLGDVWDIPYLNPKANERVGYPTQKPVLLLERIIELASSPGDTVLDPFCGSGTTLVAASLLGRNSIGVDNSSDAISLAESRLASPMKTQSRLVAVGRDAYEQVDEGALALLQGLSAIPVHRNRGIDAIVPCDEGTGNALVRVQREHEPLDATLAALQRAAAGKKASRLIVVAILPPPPSFRHPEGCWIILAPCASIRKLLGTSTRPLDLDAMREKPSSRGRPRKTDLSETQLRLLNSLSDSG